MSTIQTLVRAARVLFAAVPVFDMLKATAKKTVIIPGFYKDGKFIAPHARVVHYNPDVTFHAVATGQGSHSQKAAHKELSGMDWWNTLSVDDKALHVMVLATDKQDAASASAAVSGWKAAALAGKNPKVGQWAAFVAQPGDKQAKLYDLVQEKAGGLAHLEMPKVQQVAALPDPVPAAEPVAVPSPTPAPAPEVVPAAPIPEAPPIASAPGGADYVAMLSTMAGGSFYQKEAVAKLKGSEGWDGISDQDKYQKADALYHQLQGAASAAAAVSMFKKTMLAGKVPTPAQYNAMLDASSKVQGQVVDACVAAIGEDKYTDLFKQAADKAYAAHMAAKDKANAAPVKPVAAPAVPVAAVPDADELPPKVKDKLDDWAVDGYVDRLQDAADDHGSSQAYSDYAKKLLVQFQPIKDAVASSGKYAPLHTFTGDGLESYVYAGTGAMNGKFGVSLKDTDAGQYVDSVTFYPTEAAAISSAKSAAGVKDELKEGATKTENGKTYVLHNGKWHLASADGVPMSAMQMGAAAFASGASKSPTADPDFTAVFGADQSSNQTITHMSAWHKGWDKANLAAPVPEPVVAPKVVSVTAGASLKGKPAYDHLGHILSSNKMESPHAKNIAIKLGAQDWLAANPSDEPEMHEALASLGLSHLAGAIGMLTKPAAPAPVAPVASSSQTVMVHSQVFKNTQDGHSKSWSVSTNGNVMMTAYGKIGAKSAITKKVFASPEAAIIAANKLKDEKTAKGYKYSGQGMHTHVADAPVAGPVAAPSASVKTIDGWTYKQDDAGAWLYESQVFPGKWEPVANTVVIDQLNAGMTSATGPAFTGSMAGEYSKEAASIDASVAAGNKADVLVAYQNNKDSIGENGLKLAEHAKQGLLKLGISHAWFAVNWPKMPYTVNASNLEDAVKTGDAAKIKAVKVGGSNLLKLAKQKALDALASPAVVSVTASTSPAAHKFTPGWSFDSADNAMSGAPTLTQEGGGYTYFAAHTDDNLFQVGCINAEGNPVDHEDCATAQEAASLLNLMIDGNNAGISNVSTEDVQALTGGIKAIGPKDGDTKPGANGETLVFKDGRWHKNAVKKMTQKAAKELAIDKTGSKFSTNPATKAALKAASSGDAAGMVAAHKSALAAGWPKTAEKIKIVAQAMGVSIDGSTVAAAADNGPKVVKVAAGAKPAATSAPVAPSVPQAPSISGGGTNMSGWTQTGKQAGSNPGGKFKDKAGKEWYCKFPADADIAKNELLAAKFYQMMGVAVPNLKLVNKDGKVGIASQWVDGISKGTSEQLAKASGAHEAFAIDAWLANWDVVGLGNDNLMLNKAGAAVRVDVGGSLLYRAQGSPKGDDFGTEVTELASLLDDATNGKSAAVFGGVSKESMGWGLQQLAKLKPSQIVELCQKAGPGDDKAKAALARKLITRRANILAKMGIADPWDKPKIDEATLKVNVADLPKPIDFANFKGPGHGLSSVAKINQQNTADSAALIAFAQQGNLTALKNYQYEAFDKSTGASLGKKPITSHPAKDIQSQWSDLCELLSSIAYPPVASLEMPATGIASSMEELAEGAGFFKPEDRVETVSAEHRMGFFMKLGQMDGVDELVAGENWNWITPAHSFVATAKAGYKKLSAIVRGYISSVQASGSINHTWSLGSKTANGQGAFGLASKVYAEAETLPDNMQMWRWMNDTTAGKSMMKQLLNAQPGLVIQNTDSMCCSYNEPWGNHSHFGSDIRMRVRCAKGSKATASFSSGSFSSENEITTLPGARFVVVKTSKGIPGNPDGVSLDVIMLPPDQGYVAELSKLEVLGKSMIIFLDSKWNNKQTPISAGPSLTRSRAPSRAPTLVTRIRLRA